MSALMDGEAKVDAGRWVGAMSCSAVASQVPGVLGSAGMLCAGGMGCGTGAATVPAGGSCDAPLPCSTAMSAGSIEQEPSRKLACCGVPLITEDMQSLAIRTLSGTDINKHYDLIRELGKGTYGKVDLVSHKSTGEGSGGQARHLGVHRHRPCQGLSQPSARCRHQDGPEVRQQEQDEAEELPAGVQHHQHALLQPLHHQGLRRGLRDRGLLRLCSGVRPRRGPLRHHPPTGESCSGCWGGDTRAWCPRTKPLCPGLHIAGGTRRGPGVCTAPHEGITHLYTGRMPTLR